MNNFVLILICLALGVLLKRTRKLPEKAHVVFNSFIIHVSLPALVLVQIPELLRTSRMTSEMMVPVSMPWILFILSTGFFIWIGKRFRWSNAEIGALVLTAGLGNTSFVGFPLLEALIGPTAIPIGLLIDQLGSFLVVSTLGLIVASRMSVKGDASLSASTVLKKVCTFPPFLSLILAVLWYLTGLENPVQPALERLSSTLVPLALVGVGFQLDVSASVLKRQKLPLLIGLGFKLGLAPIFFLLLYRFGFHAQGEIFRVTILEAAMAPMITAAVVAEEFGLNTEIASLMVGVGIPLSLATVVLWNLLLNG